MLVLLWGVKRETGEGERERGSEREKVLLYACYI